MSLDKKYISQHASSINKNMREERHQHRAAILWFTGLSGSGKTTLAFALEKRLYEMGCETFVLDGDNIRRGLSKDLGFDQMDRQENIRRIGEVAKLFLEAGHIVMTAFISPYRTDRLMVRDQVKDGDFIEIYCNASLDVCELRDVKGLYKKAREGLISNFTGISDTYEMPDSPEIELHTAEESVDASVKKILDYLIEKHVFLSPS
jgi:adenylylsulfate kinase